MEIDRQKLRKYLEIFDFKSLFNYLGWEHGGHDLEVEVEGHNYKFSTVSLKRGFAVLLNEMQFDHIYCLDLLSYTI